MTTWVEHTTCHHRAYRLGCDDYERLLTRANGRCEICGVGSADTPTGRLGIDHDHKLGTGINHVRGMLCQKCNCNLKYVEQGVRQPTPEQARYLENVWYRTNPPIQKPPIDPDDPTPSKITVTLPKGLASEFRQHAGSREIVQFIGWYLRRPGAKQPRRPE